MFNPQVNILAAARGQLVGTTDSPTFVALTLSSGPITIGTTPATVGSALRLSNALSIGWRNAANNANIFLLVDSSDIMMLGNNANIAAVRTVSPLILGTDPGAGSGTGIQLRIANTTSVPSTNPSNGGIVYVESGALKYRGSSGTVTTIANA